jgi:transposase InsO family protein
MTLADSVVALRLKVMKRAEETGNVSEACRQFGISRTLFYRWRRRFVTYGEAGLVPRPTRPQRWGRQSTPELEHAVLAYALQWPTHGPQRIADQLTRPNFGGWTVSASGTYAILARHGLQTRWERLTRLEQRAMQDGLLTERTRRQLRTALNGAEVHVEAKRPGDLVCLDTFYIGQLKGVGKVWQYTACDAASSFAIALLSTEHDAVTAARFLRRCVLPALKEANHRLKAVLTDGGPEFQAAFVTVCAHLKIQHRRTRPRHPWTNGFVERLQGTILTELWRCAFRRTYYRGVRAMERDLQDYLRFYNFERPHRGYRLKGRTPGMLFIPRLFPHKGRAA